MAKYDELDALIIQSIDKGYYRFRSICQQVVSADWREVDRRLQALRRKGQITFTSKDGWRVSVIK